MEKYNIREGRREDAALIARYIMTAMTDDCCLNLAGEGRTLGDFHRAMTRLAGMEQSQYSYRNALIATDSKGQAVGACVGYDGGRLHALREAFFSVMREELGRTFEDFGDETDGGEFYIDSLAVDPQHRHRGIATLLLQAAIAKATAAGLPAGLLVDVGNPGAERLYRSLGFEDAGGKMWGGHQMKHLVRPME